MPHDNPTAICKKINANIAIGVTSEMIYMKLETAINIISMYLNACNTSGILALQIKESADKDPCNTTL